MKPTLFLRLLTIALALGLLASPKPAWACSCIYPPQPPQAYNDAMVVFAGRVTSINNPSQIPLLTQIMNTWASWTHSPAPYTFYNQRVTFAVNDSWKGVTTSTVTVQTGQGGGDCGYAFSPGQQYVVYAYDFQGTGLETNICTRTGDVASAAADLSYLNTLPTLALSPANSAIWPYAAGAAVVVAAVGVGLLWIMRRRTAATPDEG